MISVFVFSPISSYPYQVIRHSYTYLHVVLFLSWVYAVFSSFFCLCKQGDVFTKVVMIKSRDEETKSWENIRVKTPRGLASAQRSPTFCWYFFHPFAVSFHPQLRCDFISYLKLYSFGFLFLLTRIISSHVARKRIRARFFYTYKTWSG